MYVAVMNDTLLIQLVKLAVKADCFCLAICLQLEHSAMRWYLFMAHDWNTESFFRYDSLTLTGFVLIFFFNK